MARLPGIVLAMVAVAAGLVLSELGLRVLDYRYSPIKIGDSVTDDFREQHAFHDRNLVYDPDLIWRPVSGQFSPFNPQGVRGLPVSPAKPAGTLRVIAVGDSNTFGWDVDEGANWPAQLQNRFAESRPGVEVVNAGVWGYTAFQGVRRFRELLMLNPDMALISFGANDAHQVRVRDAEYVRRHERLEWITGATGHLRLAQLLVAAWDRAGMADNTSDPLVARVPLDEYVSHLREIVSIGRQHGITVVLLTRPFIGSSTDPTSWKTYAPAYNEATMAVAHAERVPLIDVYALFKDRDALFDDESHFGVEGHREAARLIHAALEDALR